MDKAVLVTTGIRAGQQLLEELVKDGFDVSAAAWLRATDPDQWYLHITSKDTRTRGSIQAAYRFLREVLDRLSIVPLYPGMPAARFDPDDVRLLYEDEQLARNIAALYREYPGLTNTFIHGGRFSPFEFDSLVYLYALPHLAPTPAAGS